MAGVLSKSRLKVPSSQRDDSYSSSQRNGTFHMTMNIPYNKENKGIYYSHTGSSFFCAKTTKIDLHQLLSVRSLTTLLLHLCLVDQQPGLSQTWHVLWFPP